MISLFICLSIFQFHCYEVMFTFQKAFTYSIHFQVNVKGEGDLLSWIILHLPGMHN